MIGCCFSDAATTGGVTNLARRLTRGTARKTIRSSEDHRSRSKEY
jgi:hypothetical protein